VTVSTDSLDMNKSASPDHDAGGAGHSPERLTVGVVRGAWGVVGGFKVEPFNDPRESVLKSVRRWWLCAPVVARRGLSPQSASPSAASPRELRLTRCRVHGDLLVAKAEGIEDRDAAEALKGMLIEIDRADLPRAAPGEYYWVDLIGCEVVGQAGSRLGVVESLDDHGAHAILVVRDGELERLIPFVDAYLLGVDLVGRRIELDWGPDW
jgi:16S rRNA processing protein RimM